MNEKLCQIKAGSRMVGLVSNAVLDNVALGWWSQIYLSSLSRELIWHFANICHQVCTLLTVVKLREREGQRVDSGRSLKGHLQIIDGGWWMVDTLSLMLYTKFG